MKDTLKPGMSAEQIITTPPRWGSFTWGQTRHACFLRLL